MTTTSHPLTAVEIECLTQAAYAEDLATRIRASARMVLELGPILGFAFIAWRIWLSLELVRQGWLAFRDGDDALSWLLAGACFMGMFNSQWGPATNLGFCVFTAGLSLAAANPPAEEAGDEEEDQPVEELAAGDESMTADTSVGRSDDPAT